MKDKKSALIVVLMFILLCAACFIIYDKVISKDNKDDTQLIQDTKIVEKTSDERYKEFLKNFKSKRESKKIELGGMYNLLNCKSGDTSVSLSSDGILKVDNETIDSNVLMYYVGDSGNGGCSFLTYIKEDGSLMSANSMGTKKLDYKNIVSMSTAVYFDAVDTVYIDIDGNIFGINE